jgi:TetR/AcrR family transcriptional regulator, cholesterol catabolism regulator
MGRGAGTNAELEATPPPEAPGSRQQILDVAIGLFFSRGYAGTSVKAIAQQVGLSTPALYWHFESKQDIFYSAMEMLLDEFMASIRAQLTTEEPVGRLRQLAEAHVRWQLERREHAGAYSSAFGFRGLVQSLPDKHHRRIVDTERAYLDEVRATLQRGAEAEVFEFADLKVTAFALITLFEFPHTWYDPAGPLSPRDVARLYAELALQMVGASR